MPRIKLLRLLTTSVGCYFLNGGEGVPSVRSFEGDARFGYGHVPFPLVEGYGLDAACVYETAA